MLIKLKVFVSNYSFSHEDFISTVFHFDVFIICLQAGLPLWVPTIIIVVKKYINNLLIHYVRDNESGSCIILSGYNVYFGDYWVNLC